jgi:hypothetical protein
MSSLRDENGVAVTTALTKVQDVMDLCRCTEKDAIRLLKVSFLALS